MTARKGMQQMLLVPVLLFLGCNALAQTLGEQPSEVASFASSSVQQLQGAPESGGGSEVSSESSTDNAATELLKQIAARSGRQWPASFPGMVRGKLHQEEKVATGFPEKATGTVHKEKQPSGFPETVAKKAWSQRGKAGGGGGRKGKRGKKKRGKRANKKEGTHSFLEDALMKEMAKATKKAEQSAMLAKEEKVEAVPEKQKETGEQDQQDEVMANMAASTEKALQHAKWAFPLNSQEFQLRRQLEEAINASREANETFERCYSEYEAGANTSETLGAKMIEEKRQMDVASQLAGTAQEELDSILQESAASNATANEALIALQAAQKTFVVANETLGTAQSAFEKAKREEEAAKKKTVEKAEKIVQAVSFVARKRAVSVKHSTR